MASETAASGYDPTYREEHVEERLDDHDRRISRLEKAALIGLGYGLASGSEVIQNLVQLI